MKKFIFNNEIENVCSPYGQNQNQYLERGHKHNDF